MKRILPLLLAFSAIAVSGEVDLKAFAESIIGKKYWLKIDVIQLKPPFGKTAHATNIYYDERVVYRVIDPNTLRYIEIPDPEQFLAVAKERRSDMSPKIIPKGTEVEVRKVKLKGDQAIVEIESPEGIKSKVYFKFGKRKKAGSKYSYDADAFRRLLFIVFSENPVGEEIHQTVEIRMGMTVDEVIKVKGAPKTRIELEGKLILIYDDMKLVFRDGKLVDVKLD